MRKAYKDDQFYLDIDELKAIPIGAIVTGPYSEPWWGEVIGFQPKGAVINMPDYPGREGTVTVEVPINMVITDPDEITLFYLGR